MQDTHVAEDVKSRSALGEMYSDLGQMYSDDELAKRARTLLRWRIRYDSIWVGVDAGHVTLSGVVSWPSDREAAEHTIRKLSGVVGVTNLITAKASAASNFKAPTGNACLLDRGICQVSGFHAS